jgi:cell division protein FtsW
MARKLKSDAVLFSTTLLLLVIGMAWVYSASCVRPDGTDIVMKQGMFLAVGTVGLFGAMRFDYRRFCNRRLLLWAVGATFLALVAVLVFGHEVNGSRRWLALSRFTVQPSEVSKLVAVMFAAAVIGPRLQDREPLEPGLFQASIVLIVFAVLILAEPDYGGGIVLLATACAMAFVSGIPYRWVATGALGMLPPLAAVLLLSQHSRVRLEAWIDPYSFPTTKGFQTLQSYIALGTGGLWGKGYLHGVQKMFYLPEAHNDYIFAMIGEEQGLIGTTIVLLCFALIIWRGLTVARRAPDAFGSLLAVGITAMLGIPALVNMGVVTNLLPAKGIALPLVSAGGSSMIVSLVAMGVLLNISQQGSATEVE